MTKINTRKKTRIGGCLAIGVAGLVSSAALVGAAGADTLTDAMPIQSAGPLTDITTTTDLNCAVQHAADEVSEFFGITACATLVAVGGSLYGPAAIPAGDDAGPRTPFTPLLQTHNLGAGTANDPITVITDVAGGDAITVTQTDSYVVGDEYYRTDVKVTNLSPSSQEITIYRAGDCYLQNSDWGYGRLDETSSGTAVSCIGVQVDDSGMPVLDEEGFPMASERIEQWVPLTSGSSFYQSSFYNVWETIGSQQAFPNTCDCDQYIDNGAGLSWTVTVPGGRSTTVSHLTAFSPTGNSPLDECLEDGTALLGGGDGGLVSGLIHSTIEPLLDRLGAQLGAEVHGLNCDVVVPLETRLDDLLG